MTIHADDLPRSVRKRLGLPKHRSKPTRAGTGGPQRTTCSCGEVFPTFPAAERHAHTESHTRLSIEMNREDTWA
jgi:hypothetical protein